jgi:hypothetical protein
MISVGLALEDEAAPRTVYYERLLRAVVRNRRFRRSAARVVLPAEDTALETNWPRYGDRLSAYVRGQPDEFAPEGPFERYLNRVGAYAQGNPEQAVLLVGMNPFLRLPMLFRSFPNVLIADGSLAGHERSLSPRSISMPALPMVDATAEDLCERDILASFRGADSHPVRRALAKLAGRAGFEVQLADPGGHAGKIDATAGLADARYVELLDRSVFSFVPRGDALFSYRLLEAMARGSIPVILSDGWVLPFDRLIDWDTVALRVHQDAVPQLPEILGSLHRVEIDSLQAAVRFVYRERFSDLERIVETLFSEVELLLDG